MSDTRNIVIENELCKLTIGCDGLAKSLIIKENDLEVLRCDEEIAFFSVTQERPYNNEVKLAHPNKRTTYQANSVEWDGDTLIVGFEIVPVRARVGVKVGKSYISFELLDFVFDHKLHYEGLHMTPPPVAEMRLIQLPVLNRKNFGEWLNVSWDDDAAINVLAASPYARIDSERRRGYRIMSADAVRGIKLRGTVASIVAAKGGEQLLDSIAELEEDYGLPHGVESRRRKHTINSSAYWTANIGPDNVDEHIKYAKLGGFKMMLIYYPAIFATGGGYQRCGDYEIDPKYNGAEGLRAMLAKIKSAGITPGLHFLQTHIGLESSYVTPSVDPRLNLTRRFTLARPLSFDDTTVYVEEDPTDTVMFETCRYLNFGGELISYESYTTEPPYAFVGCKRGTKNTTVKEHPKGLSGGILDISEFAGISAYIDQRTNLQDEIADKLAYAYNQGFEYIYFDGSEGTNIPHDFYVPYAQYRVLKKLDREPLYTEGAAKAHFSWHFLSGGNAFDVFPPRIFKRMIDKFPLEEAPRMRQDFTRLNFGWWGYYNDTQPDMFEYGTSKAAAWDCPVTFMEKLAVFGTNKRTLDALEVMRRWEDARAQDILTEEDKLKLRVPENEYILLINEEGKYELAPYYEVSCEDTGIAAFVFERRGASYAVFWHKSDEGTMSIKTDAEISLIRDLNREAIPFTDLGNEKHLPIGNRAYIKTSISIEELKNVMASAKLV